MYFKSQIFMGCSQKGTTEYEIIQLQNLLREALSIISGEQQNGGMGYPYDKKEGRQARQDLKRITREIAMALTGRKIRFMIREE